MEQASSGGFFADVDLLALNQDEAATLAGRSLDRARPRPLLEACAMRLRHWQPEIRLVVTAGAAGVFGGEGGRSVHLPALKVPVKSTAGAGDALLGGILAGLAAGIPLLPSDSGEDRTSLADRPLASALELGALLAAYAVTSPHSIHPEARLETLRAFAVEQGVTFAGPLRRHFAEAA
jgi:sugar/nucleoside kinase (ribokinase family)